MKLFYVVGVLTLKTNRMSVSSHSGVHEAHSEEEAIGKQMKDMATQFPHQRVETIHAYDISAEAKEFARKYGPSQLRHHEIRP